MAVVTSDSRAVGAEFVDALAAQDFERLERCLAPDVVFRAVVPNDAKPFREKTSAADTVAQLRAWLGDADPLRLLGSAVEVVADKLRIDYRFAAREDGEWSVVEQRGYATVGERGIEKLDLVCSGFAPTAEPS